MVLVQDKEKRKDEEESNNIPSLVASVEEYNKESKVGCDDEENGKPPPVSMKGTIDDQENKVENNGINDIIEVKAGGLLWSRWVSCSTTKSYLVGLSLLIFILLMLIVILCVYIARDGFGSDDEDVVINSEVSQSNNNVTKFAKLEFERFHPDTTTTEVSPSEQYNNNFVGTKIDCLHTFLGKIYFMVNENEIWATDGEIVELIFNVNDVLSEIHALHGHLNHIPCFIEMNNTHLFFTIYLIDEQLELLWKMNGTSAELVDIFSDIDWWHEKKHTIIDGKLYFVASKHPMNHDSGVFQYSLYATDGQEVALVYEDEDVYSIDIEATINSNLLLFQTREIEDEIGSLLATDDSIEGIDIISQRTKLASPSFGRCPGSTDDDGKYIFVDKNELDDYTLWLTDGTIEGTEPIFHWAIPHQNHFMFTEPFQDIIFIIISGSDDMEGINLWKTDCTTPGTSLLYENMGIGWYTSFLNLNNESMLLFGDNYDTTFAVSDGTIEGTKELQIPADKFQPYSPTAYMSKAYLVAKDHCPTEEEGNCNQLCMGVSADRHTECIDTCKLQSQCEYDIIVVTNGTTTTVERKGSAGDDHSFWVYDHNLVFQLGDELEGNLNLWLTDGEEYTLLFDSNCIPNIDDPSYCSVYLPTILVNNRLIFLFQNQPTIVSFWKSQFTLDDPAT